MVIFLARQKALAEAQQEAQREVLRASVALAAVLAEPQTGRIIIFLHRSFF